MSLWHYYRHQFTGQLIMNFVWKKAEGVLRRDTNNKSQGIYQIKSIVTQQLPFIKKKNGTNEDLNLIIWWCHGFQCESAKVLDWSPKVWQVYRWGIFLILMRLKKNKNGMTMIESLHS